MKGHADFEYLPFGHPAKEKGCSEIENDYFEENAFKTNWSKKILNQKTCVYCGCGSKTR